MGYEVTLPQNTVGASMFAGISDAGRSLGEGIASLGRAHKEAKAYRAMAVDVLGMDPEQADKLSAETIRGKIQAHTMMQQDKEHKAQMDMYGARTRDSNVQANQRTQLMQMQQFTDEAHQGLIPLAAAWQKSNPDKRMTPGDFINILADAPLSPGAKSAAMRELEPHVINRMMGEDVKPKEGETSDHQKYLYGKSGQFQFLPAGDGAGAAAEDITDAEGNVLGQGIRNPKTGALTMVKRTKEAKTLPDSYNKILRGTASDPGLLDDIRIFTRNAGKTDAELKKIDPATPPATLRAGYQTKITAAQADLKNHLDSFREQGYGTPDFWAKEYQRYNLGAPSASQSTPAGADAPGAAGAAAAPSKRVRVTGPNGAKGTITEGDTLPQGWSLE